MNIFEKPIAYDGDENYIFISYSHESKRDVYKILHKLNLAGIRFWYDDNLEHGVNWKNSVYEKICKATCVWFFFDAHFFSSHSLKEEVILVNELKKKYSPIYYTGQMYKDIYKLAIKEDLPIEDTIEEIISPYFRSEIVSSINDNYQAFIDELVREAHKINAIGEASFQQYKTQVKKYAFIAKDSSFSKNIALGITNVFSEIDSKVEKVLLNADSFISFDMQMRKIFKKVCNEDFSGIVIRPTGIMSDETFKIFKQICHTCPVIVSDIDITSRQRAELGADAPIFVCSDFEAGGKMLGEFINRLCCIYGIYNTDIIICKGPKKNSSAELRSEALIKEINITNLKNAKILELDSLKTDNVKDRIIPFIIQNIDNNECDKNLIVFAGNDNIAYKLECYLSQNTIQQITNCYKKITIVGYDGIKDGAGNSILHSAIQDSATIDVNPVYQGETIAHTLLDFVEDVPKSTNIKVTPKLIENITKSNNVVNSLSKILPVVDNAGLYIFDLDGTIADTELLHWEAYNVLLEEEYGFKLTDSDIKRYIGNSEKAIYKMIESDYQIKINVTDFLSKRITAYLKLVEQRNLQPFKWVSDFIGEFPNAPILLLTSQVPEVVDYLLSYWGLDDVIPKKMRISVHDGNISKAEVFADPYAYIEKSKEDSRIVVFEDSDHVAKLAASFGYTIIGITHSYNKGVLKHCDIIIDEGIKKGLFVGLGGIDIIYLLNNLPVSNTKVKTNDYNITVGGPALNAAITCAKLGGDATLVTCLGRSAISNIVKDVCAKHRVKLIDLMPNKNKPNISFVAVDLKKSHRTIVSGQTLDGITGYLSSDFLDDFDYCLYDCNIPIFTKKLVELLSDNYTPLILDCGSWKENIEYALKYADVVISSENFSSPDEKDIFALQELYSLHHVAKTRGDKSIFYKDYGDELAEIEVDKIDNAYTLGAGDVFHGAFCHYFYNLNCDFRTALEKATKYAHYYISEGFRKTDLLR